MALFVDPQQQQQGAAAATPAAAPVPLTEASAGGGGSAPGASLSTSQPLAPDPGVAPPAPQPFSTGSEFRQYLTSGSGPVADRVFGGIRQSTQAQSAGIQDASRNFYDLAGPQRTFEGIGAEGQLAGSLQTGDLDPARQLISSQYTGPYELDRPTVDSAYAALQDLQPAGRALSGGNLAGLIGTAAPGLTPGEQSFEAREWRKNPGFQEQSKTATRSINELFQFLKSSEQKARDFGQGREESEADIATRSRGYLTGERGGVYDALDALVKQYTEADAQATEQYQGFRESGDLEDLRAIAPDSLDFDPESFDTEARQKNVAAREKYDEIMARYPDLEGTPTMQLGTGRHGRSTLFSMLRGLVGDEPDTRQYERQRELHKSFSPGSREYGVYPGFDGRNVGEAGEFSTEIPLYYGADNALETAWQPTDIRNYISYEESMPTRQNIATEDQRTVINRVNQILGVAEQLEEADLPYLSARIHGNVERFMQEEQDTLKQRGGALDNAVKEWRGAIGKSRRKYKKRQSKLALDTTLTAILGTLSAGTLFATPLPALWGAEYGHSIRIPSGGSATAGTPLLEGTGGA